MSKIKAIFFKTACIVLFCATPVNNIRMGEEVGKSGKAMWQQNKPKKFIKKINLADLIVNFIFAISFEAYIFYQMLVGIMTCFTECYLTLYFVFVFSILIRLSPLLRL